MNLVSGFLNVDKPIGITSHDVVGIVRRGIGLKKVGHAGTLDPLATGVLVICVGHATRLSDFVMSHTKVYEAEVFLGVETDTYDAEGQITAQNPTPISPAQVEALFPQFTGTIQQIPPMYSAIKQGGKKLYELARRGETVERPARQITIEHLEISHWDFPRFGLRVQCSAGTYIRSLAHDIGEALGVGAHLSALRRLVSGAFKVEDAHTIEQLQEAFAQSTWSQLLAPSDSALQLYPRFDLNPDEVQLVLNGGFIERPAIDTEWGRAYDIMGNLIALLEPIMDSPRPNQQILWKPSKVFK